MVLLVGSIYRFPLFHLQSLWISHYFWLGDGTPYSLLVPHRLGVLLECTVESGPTRYIHEPAPLGPRSIGAHNIPRP